MNSQNNTANVLWIRIHIRNHTVCVLLDRLLSQNIRLTQLQCAVFTSVICSLTKSWYAVYKFHILLTLLTVFSSHLTCFFLFLFFCFVFLISYHIMTLHNPLMGMSQLTHVAIWIMGRYKQSLFITDEMSPNRACRVDAKFCQLGQLSSNHDHNNSSPHSGAYMRQWTGSALLQAMARRLLDAKPLPEPMLTYCQLNT